MSSANCETAAQKPTQRVIAYVDGFNLYYGLVESDMRKYLWLNVHSLCQSMLLPHQELVLCKYFTSRITGATKGMAGREAAAAEAKRKRQSIYLDVLGTVTGLEIYYGKFYTSTNACLDCGKTWPKYEEKMTDVQIALKS